MSQKFRPLILSVLFLFASLGTYQIGATYLTPTEHTVSSESPVGTWRQYVIDDGQPVYLATFTFSENQGDYSIEANQVAPVTFPQSDFYTFGHKFDGQTWGFHSDWHEYGVAWFELNKVADGHYEGYAYLDGERRPSRHILIREN